MQDEWLLDADGEAMAMLGEARIDPERGCSMDHLARALIGSRPRYVRMVGTADIWPFQGEWVLRVHRALPPEVQRAKVAHELAEWRATTTHRHFASNHEREAWCNAVGARLLCPTAAFRSLVRRVGHRVHGLAEAFGVPQSLALLRIGEVTGRPVALVRAQPLARGLPFAWPADLPRAVRRRPVGIHPIRVDGGLGLMVETETWLAMAA